MFIMGVLQASIDDGHGFASVRSLATCMGQAWRDGAKTAVFMQDDARPFVDQGNTHLCAPGYRAKLWAAMPPDALVALLGGHHITYDAHGHTHAGKVQIHHAGFAPP